MTIVYRFLRIAIALALTMLVVTTPRLAQAQSDNMTTTPDGQVITLPPGTPKPTPSDNSGATFKPGEVGTGSKKALAAITSLFNAVIGTAVTASELVKPEADKLAGGLAVITVVLAFARYAAMPNPTLAWLSVFEELATLGIFASIYIGYASFATGFYGWFGTLANDISGANVSGGATGLGAAASDLYDAFAKAFNGAEWYQYPKLFMAMGPIILAYLLLSITAVVFTFFANIGQLQAAAGIVMGQIAVALGFSSFTRGYFKSWLDYMVSACMYTVVAAILMKLVSGSLLSALEVGRTIGLSTDVGASYVFDLSFFVFLVSFEIPKIAGMFGGGASASGGILGTVAKKAASGGLV